MSCIVTRKDHSLVDISSTSRGYGMAEVVRWCRDCGAIVVDVDVDGRVSPGAVSPMVFPLLAKREAARADRNELLAVRS